MKKFLIISLFIFSLMFTYSASADGVTTKNKLFKEITLSNSKIQKDYGNKYIKALDLYFTKIRYYNNKNELLNLEKKLEPIIVKYNNKSNLSIKEQKQFNMIKNIYYRSKVLSNYYLK
ncbi:MAG: hypothetical protein PHI37_00050 [Candidatus Gracilibacteria bacterium]|nr:hypothetical protein [Candidatus Gracilibacteria bacterium]